MSLPALGVDTRLVVVAVVLAALIVYAVASVVHRHRWSPWRPWVDGGYLPPSPAELAAPRLHVRHCLKCGTEQHETRTPDGVVPGSRGTWSR